jgi:hypothetical protein
MAWVAAGSLKGPQGIQGLPGVDGPAGPAGADGAQGIQGEQGIAGPEGPQGQQGIQGAAGLGITFKGQVATEMELPVDAAQGDAYIVQADDSFQVWDAASSSWVNGGSIQGPQGIAGPQGPQGLQGDIGPQGLQGIDGPAGMQGVRGTGWFNGSGAPAADIPGSIPGDLYLDKDSGDVYTLS